MFRAILYLIGFLVFTSVLKSVFRILAKFAGSSTSGSGSSGGSGSGSDGLNPAFANATYRCDPRDWAYWITDPPKTATGELRPTTVLQKELLEAVADRVEPWTVDGPLLPGVNVMHAPGHTPGSAIMVVSDGDARALLLGDVVHCPVELLESEWGGLGDVDPALAKQTRNALARELEGKETPISAAHFPGMQFGRLLSAEGRRRWVV